MADAWWSWRPQPAFSVSRARGADGSASPCRTGPRSRHRGLEGTRASRAQSRSQKWYEHFETRIARVERGTGRRRHSSPFADVIRRDSIVGRVRAVSLAPHAQTRIPAYRATLRRPRAAAAAAVRRPVPDLGRLGQRHQRRAHAGVRRVPAHSTASRRPGCWRPSPSTCSSRSAWRSCSACSPAGPGFSAPSTSPSPSSWSTTWAACGAFSRRAVCCVIGLYLATHGAGRFSFDEALRANEVPRAAGGVRLKK